MKAPPGPLRVVQTPFHAHWEYGRSRRAQGPHVLRSVSLPYVTVGLRNPTSAVVASYPVGHFGGNQLLGGSMSLSPLCEDRTSNLHVSIVTIFHRTFPHALICPRKDHHLSGLSIRTLTEHPRGGSGMDWSTFQHLRPDHGGSGLAKQASIPPRLRAALSSSSLRLDNGGAAVEAHHTPRFLSPVSRGSRDTLLASHRY